MLMLLVHCCCVSYGSRSFVIVHKKQLVITIVKQLLLPIGLSTAAVVETNEQLPYP